jgi:hypothetical protein
MAVSKYTKEKLKEFRKEFYIKPDERMMLIGRERFELWLSTALEEAIQKGWKSDFKEELRLANKEERK